MTTLADAIRRAERRALEAKRDAERARADADRAPGDLELRHTAEDRTQEHRDRGRELAELRREAEREAEIERLQDIGAYVLRDDRQVVETFAGWRERQESGRPLAPIGADRWSRGQMPVAYDATR